ncbi:MAG: pyrroline-5-carboxylate reductase [Clostridia bacterium]|nr:pyrroline-5-carboxylate reductase [Clostridia bacterium]
MKLGFIGAGNMAGAMMGGIAGAGVIERGDICAFDIDRDKIEAIENRLGVKGFSDVDGMIAACDMIVIAIKPNVVKDAVLKSKSALAGKAVVSIAAGWTTKALKDLLDPSTRLLRVMPNTPALCGAGMTALSVATTFTPAEKEFAQKMFSSFGLYEWVREDLIDAAVGVSGSGPAYVYMFIEALADAGVSLGLTRAQAVKMAAQTVKGSAQMVMDTGKHPGELKDMVCSPGGTTIEAVRVLERNGLRSAVMEAAIAAAEKAKSL